jgi:AcrR family transcriptional regulator
MTADLERLRGFVAVVEVLEREIADAVAACLAEGVERTEVARSLGVHRATVYRRYLSERSAGTAAG